jgi:hypothetical protein
MPGSAARRGARVVRPDGAGMIQLRLIAQVCASTAARGPSSSSGSAGGYAASARITVLEGVAFIAIEMRVFEVRSNAQRQEF